MTMRGSRGDADDLEYQMQEYITNDMYKMLMEPTHDME
jgi:hypothetical protein